MEYTLPRSQVIHLLRISSTGLRYLEKTKKISFKINPKSVYKHKQKYYNKEEVTAYAATRKKYFARPLKRTRFTTPQGYVLVSAPDHPACNSSGCVYEHRLMMEQCIGRYLTELETVVHLDGNKSNNKPDNLYLCEEPGVDVESNLQLAYRLMNAANDLSKRVAIKKFLEKLNV